VRILPENGSGLLYTLARHQSVRLGRYQSRSKGISQVENTINLTNSLRMWLERKNSID
jgi:hypothetical protein